jgi:hypothetical protein
VAVFVAYSDEAGVGDPGGEFLIAGHVADEKEWPWITDAWQNRVLDGPPKLPYLHMVDIRSREWRKQQAITFNDGEERVSEAVRVLYSMGAMSALCSVIKRSELAEAIQSKFKRKNQIPIGVNEPDYICFLAYASYVLREVQRRHPETERVNFVVSKKENVSEHYRDFVRDIKRYLGLNSPERASLVGDLIPASMEDQLPLQAADVLCWHLQRYYTKNFDREIESRMWRLLKERDGHLHVWTKSELKEIAERLGLTSKPSSVARQR